MRWLRKEWHWAFPVMVAFVFLATRLPALTSLPVFADEAIYIRWSQLIISDWRQYLWFPLNDGKTPLYNWLLVPWLLLLPDPLWAARFLSVVIGAAQLAVFWLLFKALGLGKAGVIAGMSIVLTAPFWFFHHRMALMDGLLVMWFSIAILAALSLAAHRIGKRKQLTAALSSPAFAAGAVAIWLGLLTKVPFVLAIPGICMLFFSKNSLSRRELQRRVMLAGAMVAVGSLLFSGILLAPAFTQLISRGSDFLLSPSEVFMGGWKQTLPNIGSYINYLYEYAGWGTLLLAVVALLLPSRRRLAGLLFCSFLIIFVPIWLMGKMVYPRYVLPVMIPLTLMAAIGADALWRTSRSKVQSIYRRRAFRLLTALAITQICLNGLLFILPSLLQPGQIPFVSSDKNQYLAEWSSGHGITDTYSLIQKLSAEKPDDEVIVITEGRFGTLPDALLMYNFARPLPNVWIEGLGYPIGEIPESIQQRYQTGDQVLLVANSNRVTWQLSADRLQAEYCRPIGTVCLQIWDVTNYVSDLTSR